MPEVRTGGIAVEEGRPPPDLRVRVLRDTPARWDLFERRVQAAETTTGITWTECAARHYRNAWPLWIVAELPEGELAGCLPLFARRRRGLVSLQSSLDGTVAGPLVAADLPPFVQDQVFAALCRRLASMVRGRTALAAVTVGEPEARRRMAALPLRDGWRLLTFQSAVVDCRPGLERIEAEAWTKNRRNERNRGLRRGCTLHTVDDPKTLDLWYPIYLAQARRWLQAPVPRGFLADLLRLEPRRVCLNVVRLEERVVGGHFCVISRRRLVPYLSGAEPALLGTHFLHTLLYWLDISLACSAGLEAVDFGGCVGRDSLWDFKRRCGGVAEPRLQLQVRSRLGRWLGAAAELRLRLRGAGR